MGLLFILAAIVIFQYLLIAGFLFTLPAKNRLLAAFFLLIAVNLIDGLLMIKDSFPLAYGPILYLYTRTIIRPDKKRSLKDLLHFVPAAVGLLLIISVAHNYSVTLSLLAAGCVFMHFSVYLILSFIAIQTYHLSLHDRYASLENVNVGWLEFTLRILGITFIISWFVTSASFLGYQDVSEAGLVVMIGMLLYYIIKLLLQRMKDPRLFSAIDLSMSAKRYSRQALDENGLNEIRKKLDEIEKEKIYIDAELTIDSLSERIGIPTRLLSQFLNDVLKKSFFDYINDLRIAEAKWILSESTDPKLTVQAVMYQVGFNSKSSFNTLFKQKTGFTPAVFKKMHSGS